MDCIFKLFCLVFITTNNVCVSHDAVIEKRILLTDQSTLVEKVDNLQQQIQQLNSELSLIKGYQGSTYTRWGRNDCPANGASLVYKGFMAGTYLDPPDPAHGNFGGGNGGNFLCLSDAPNWDHYTDQMETNVRITGVEYEFTGHVIPDFLGSSLRNGEAPCAVCHISRFSNIMIPGRTECYDGWTKEYSGYLVTGSPIYADSTEYVCLDRRPEPVAATGQNDNENLLYFVEAHCDKGLECPPYVHGREITCVVCSM